MEHQQESNLVPEALIPLRAEIDKIDHAILHLLGKRNAVVDKVAQVQKSTGLGIRDFIRERDLLGDRGQRAEGIGLRSEVIESLFRVIVWASRDRQASLGAELPKDMKQKTPVTVMVMGAHVPVKQTGQTARKKI